MSAASIPVAVPPAAAPAAPPGSRPTLVIEPSRGFARLGLRELWAYRGLLGFLVWRDVKVRYAQTVLGGAWAVLQPVLTMLVFTAVFGGFARIPSEGVPYPVFALAALVPWTYFSSSLTRASNSLIANTGLITKVYFPRLVMPLAAVLAGLLDLVVGLAFLAVVMLAYGVAPTAAALVAVPLAVLAMAVTAAGLGAWLAALNIQYRDVAVLVPFLVQVWMYASPVIYPTSMVPARYRPLYSLNPLVGVIESVRAALFGTAAVPWNALGVSLAVGAVLLVTGALYFRRTERLFADVA